MKEEKKTTSKRTIGIIIGVIMAVIVLGAVVVMGMDRDFDAQKYVNVILDYTFKGEAEDVGELFEEASLVQMEKQYEENITTFVNKNITSGTEVEAEMKEKYTALCKDIFKAMKYHVKKTEKINGDEYKVTVEYQAADIFPIYRETASQEIAKMMEKVEKGEYQGETTEEINLQMRQDTINNNYELLRSAYQNIQYGKKEYIVFTVKRSEENVFTLDSATLSEFLAKILSLDEIQD